MNQKHRIKRRKPHPNVDFLIKRAQPEHAPALSEISIAAKSHWGYPKRWIEIWTPALTISAEFIFKHETWVIFINEKPVGFYSLKQDSHDLWLENLWVLPEWIGHGIGRLLFQHALEQSRLQNAKILKIESDPNATGFYEKMGAHKVGEHHSEVEVDGQPRILPIMEINL